MTIITTIIITITIITKTTTSTKQNYRYHHHNNESIKGSVEYVKAILNYIDLSCFESLCKNDS